LRSAARARTARSRVVRSGDEISYDGGFYSRGSRLRVGELEIDAAARVVRLHGAPVELSQKEFALVRTLASDPTRVFTKDELLRTIWGFARWAVPSQDQIRPVPADRMLVAGITWGAIVRAGQDWRWLRAGRLHGPTRCPRPAQPAHPERRRALRSRAGLPAALAGGRGSDSPHGLDAG
jgi:hypothetical protein